jgi:L-threonylcarbamoyladenylate synthase
MTEVLRISSKQIDQNALARACEVVLTGGVIIAPTDTIYGLCGDATDERLVRHVFAIKGRDYVKPLSIFVSSPAEVVGWARVVSAEASQLMDAFWPGALTLVLPASDQVHPWLVGGGKTIGIRIPNHPFLLELLRQCRRALTATSANFSGEPDPRSAEDAVEAIGEPVDLVLDAGPSPDPTPSTVIDVSMAPPLVRRQGRVSVSEIEKVVGKVAVHEPR